MTIQITLVNSSNWDNEEVVIKWADGKSTRLGSGQKVEFLQADFENIIGFGVRKPYMPWPNPDDPRNPHPRFDFDGNQLYPRVTVEWVPMSPKKQVKNKFSTEEDTS